MNKVAELEKAVCELTDEEYRAFRQWFLEQEEDKWDKEIEADSKSGKLDFLIEEATDTCHNERL